MGSTLPCCLPCGKAGGLQILCCQGIAAGNYSFTLDALALKPSSFCNVGVDLAVATAAFCAGYRLVRVNDGDTIKIVKDGKVVTVRLVDAIQAPARDSAFDPTNSERNG